MLEAVKNPASFESITVRNALLLLFGAAVGKVNPSGVINCIGIKCAPAPAIFVTIGAIDTDFAVALLIFG
ncbi:hypothetical protein KCP75_20385 [Salmonella enterica subsp. enterica]|nr:hypothetical protein KCP75_20385 [Salmonella enterica subsp. enterica]